METKERISSSLKQFYTHNPKCHTLKCVVCGKEFEQTRNSNGRLSNKKTCSTECHTQLKRDNGTKSYKTAKEKGTFVGWRTRNITSYPEKFWIDVLTNNNIPFERELFYDNKYFLDFVIRIGDCLIDLEIDGKQHQYEDRLKHDLERDKYLKERGVIVYRIKWNTIYTEKGKALMKTKINDFLSFINNIGW